MTRLPEVISTVRRRRAWSVEEKVAILDAAFSKGGSVAAAADAFGVSRALIYIWRDRVREGAMPGVSMTDAGVSAFAPVVVEPVTAKRTSARTAVMPEPRSLPPPSPPEKACRSKPAKSCNERRRASVIEVRLVNGRSLQVDEAIAPDVLAQLVAALDGDAS